MRFGVREICNVIFKAKSFMEIGNKKFYKGEPVIKFETLKTSTLEGAATTVYATGGRGNARLVAWDGERTVTFTMEDALISAESLSVLTGAGIVDTAGTSTVPTHVTEYIEYNNGWTVSEEISTKDGCTTVYLMSVNENGEFTSEPYVCVADSGKTLKLATSTEADVDKTYAPTLPTSGRAFVDYYTEKSNTMTMSIKADSFGGNFYIEAETLFREEGSGQDMPAEFIIPNGRIQSNFTFSMASSGDPSTFTFTVDAFPAMTKFSKEKVYCDIQVIYDDIVATDADLRKDTATFQH